MTQKFNVNIVRNFANWGMPYYGFNYVEGGRTNAIHIHKDHPIFKRIEAPKAKKWLNQQKYIITANKSSKTKMEYGIKYYIYEPEIEIENLEKVNQCLICQDNYNNRNNYNDCTCSCEEIDDDCTCYQILENKITVPPKKE